MSNYCTASDVQVLAGYPIAFNDLGTGAGSSKPTLAQVTANITDVTNEIDLYLTRIGITTQPTDTKILGKLKIGCKYGSAALSGFGYLSQATNQSGTKPKTFWDIYREFLQEIIDSPEIYVTTTGNSGLDCGYNDQHTEAENKETMMQQDWKC